MSIGNKQTLATINQTNTHITTKRIVNQNLRASFDNYQMANKISNRAEQIKSLNGTLKSIDSNNIRKSVRFDKNGVQIDQYYHHKN